MESVKIDQTLIDFIKTQNKIVSICVPIIADSHKLANIMRKRLDKGFPEVYYVSWKENEENSSYITYDKLMDYRTKNKNCLFIADSWEDFSVYFEELFKENVNNNYYMMMFDSKPKKKKNNIDITIYIKNILFLWPAFADMEFEFNENKRNVYLNKQQSDNYVTLYDSFNKFYMNDSLKNMNISKEDLVGNLNVYYDNIVSNLSNTSTEIAFKRSPKFKSIITDLLLENKKRHVVHMMDGKYGLDAFTHLYNQVKSKNNSIPYLMVIKKSEGPQELEKKLISFNSTNIPTILATDVIFSSKNMPKNVDCFKFTNGGNDDYVESLLDMAKAEFYTGNYPRKFEVTSYISQIVENMITLDMINDQSFSKKFNKALYNNIACKNSLKIFIKEEDFYLTVTRK